MCKRLGGNSGWRSLYDIDDVQFSSLHSVQIKVYLVMSCDENMVNFMGRGGTEILRLPLESSGDDESNGMH